MLNAEDDADLERFFMNEASSSYLSLCCVIVTSAEPVPGSLLYTRMTF